MNQLLLARSVLVLVLVLVLVVLMKVSNASEPIVLDSSSELREHMDQLNQHLHSVPAKKTTLNEKYYFFPGEEQPDERTLQMLKREELRLRLKVQDVRDEFGRLSPEYARVVHQYGGNLYQQMRFDDLFDLAKEIVDIHEKMDGPEHFNTGRALDNLGSAAYRVKNHKVCDTAMKRALSIFNKTFGKESKEVRNVMNSLLTSSQHSLTHSLTLCMYSLFYC
jgi:hypothetical protein